MQSARDQRIGGNIWDNFSSQSYKDLPSVGRSISMIPFTGAPSRLRCRRAAEATLAPPPSISLWSTAPVPFANNSIGKFNPSPRSRRACDSFQDSIEKMLWPEKREKDSVLGDKIPGTIDRTTDRAILRVPAGYVPSALQGLLSPAQRWFPWFFSDEGVQIGPIPKGTPIDSTFET